MYAVVGASKIDPGRADEAVKMAEGILANLGQADGFVSGAFTRSPDGLNARSMVLFETEDAAKAVVANAENLMPENPPVELISLDVFEVVSHR